MTAVWEINASKCFAEICITVVIKQKADRAVQSAFISRGLVFLFDCQSEDEDVEEVQHLRKDDGYHDDEHIVPTRRPGTLSAEREQTNSHFVLSENPRK